MQFTGVHRPLYLGDQQPLHRCMDQHQRASSSHQDSVVHLTLKEKRDTPFEDENLHVLNRKEGAKEAIYVRQEQPSLNRGGGLKHQLSTT